MPRFIAVHTLPYSEADFMKYIQNMPPMPAGFSWKRTFCDFADKKFFCEWEAPGKDALEQAFKAQKMPFDAVYPVRLFDVATKKLEK